MLPKLKGRKVKQNTKERRKPNKTKENKNKTNKAKKTRSKQDIRKGKIEMQIQTVNRNCSLNVCICCLVRFD